MNYMKYCLLFCLMLLPAAAQNCTNASYFGDRYYLLDGYVQNYGGTLVPDKQFGKLIADGKGTLSGTFTEASEGAVTKQSFIGTYTINSDCSGTRTLTITPPAGMGAIYTTASSFQLSMGENRALITTTAPGVTLTGVEYASASNCTVGAFAGTYALLGSGAPFGLGAPFTLTGLITLDGKGMISSFYYTMNKNGLVTKPSGTGSYTVAADCSATANFTGTYSGNLALALLANGTVLALQSDPGTLFSAVLEPVATPSVLAQVAFGGGWYTALYFTNDTANTRSFNVNFIADSGAALNLPGGIGNTATVTLAPQSSAIVEAPNTGALNQGFATVSLPPGVNAYGVIRQSVDGIADQEAVVPLSSASSTKVTLSWDETKYTTAVALVNPGSVAALLSVTVTDANGKPLGSSSLPLSPKTKRAATLRSLLTDPSALDGQRGYATFTVNAGNIAVLGLRFNGSAFTSIPTTGN